MSSSTTLKEGATAVCSAMKARSLARGRATIASLPTTQGRKTDGFQSDVTTVRGEVEEEDEEKNVEGLVRKSKGFLPINISNPKEEFSDTQGTVCIGEAKSTTIGLKEKLVGVFS